MILHARYCSRKQVKYLEGTASSNSGGKVLKMRMIFVWLKSEPIVVLSFVTCKRGKSFMWEFVNKFLMYCSREMLPRASLLDQRKILQVAVLLTPQKGRAYSAAWDLEGFRGISGYQLKMLDSVATFHQSMLVNYKTRRTLSDFNNCTDFY